METVLGKTDTVGLFLESSILSKEVAYNGYRRLSSQIFHPQRPSDASVDGLGIKLGANDAHRPLLQKLPPATFCAYIVSPQATQNSDERRKTASLFARREYSHVSSVASRRLPTALILESSQEALMNFELVASEPNKAIAKSLDTPATISTPMDAVCSSLTPESYPSTKLARGTRPPMTSSVYSRTPTSSNTSPLRSLPPDSMLFGLPKLKQPNSHKTKFIDAPISESRVQSLVASKMFATPENPQENTSIFAVQYPDRYSTEMGLSSPHHSRGWWNIIMPPFSALSSHFSDISTSPETEPILTYGIDHSDSLMAKRGPVFESLRQTKHLDSSCDARVAYDGARNINQENLVSRSSYKDLVPPDEPATHSTNSHLDSCSSAQSTLAVQNGLNTISFGVQTQCSSGNSNELDAKLLIGGDDSALSCVMRSYRYSTSSAATSVGIASIRRFEAVSKVQNQPPHFRGVQSKAASEIALLPISNSNLEACDETCRKKPADSEVLAHFHGPGGYKLNNKTGHKFYFSLAAFLVLCLIVLCSVLFSLFIAPAKGSVEVNDKLLK